MKRIYNILILSIVIIFCATSCETYKEDYDQGFSVIYPICGEWFVNITDNTTGESEKTVIYTYDTAEKSQNRMWLWINKPEYGTKCKISCDVANLTFSGSNAENVLLKGTCNVENGKVVVNGATTPSGGKADSIELTYYSSLSGQTYSISGFRRTGWPEDEV